MIRLFAIGCAIGVAALVASSCREPTAPDFPANATLFAAPAQYAFWWKVTEQCSGLSGDMTSIRWYSTPEPSIDGPTDTMPGVAGEWIAASRQIVLTTDAAQTGQIVRHEMLHALLGNTPGHPGEFFLQRCGGLVDCVGPCLTEGGVDTLAVVIAPTVPLDDLIVTAAILPTPATLDSTGGWFIVATSIANPLATPVWAKLVPSSAFSRASPTFGFIADGAWGGGTYGLTDSVTLAAHEVRRFSFDVSPVNQPIPDGEHSLRPFFNADTGAAVSFTIAR